jgi:hypothetical protein
MGLHVVVSAFNHHHQHHQRNNPVSARRLGSLSVPTNRGINPSSSSRTTLYNLFDKFIYDSKIPPELEKEIYAAEANTAAAKDRGTRIFAYTTVAVVLILCAFFNGFLTELRSSGIPETTTSTGIVIPGIEPNTNPDDPYNYSILNQAGFGWVLSNPVSQFVFTNQVGGGICLLLGGGSGLLAEAELDSRRINAERIYEELERRRAEKSKTRTVVSDASGTKKKKLSGKQKKRMQALSEVVQTEASEPDDQQQTQTSVTEAPKEPQDSSEGGGSGGLLGQMKSLYEKADSMAASQALLLNKQLEDAGVVEKITDETGLKVIGKEEARKLQEQQPQQSEKSKE